MSEYFTLGNKRFVFRKPLYRFRHDIEIKVAPKGKPTGVWRPKLPEVHPIYPNHFSWFSRAWQIVSRVLNSRISDSKWTTVYRGKAGSGLWIANNNGFDDGRANYITGENLDGADPKVECLNTGGSVCTGEVQGDYLIVEVLDWRKPVSTNWFETHPEHLVYAVSNDSNGVPRRFPQGLQPNGEVVPIVHPFIGDPSRGVLKVELYKLQPWPHRELPDPYTLYEV